MHAFYLPRVSGNFYTICRKHPVKMSFVRVRRSNSAGIPRKQKTHKKKPAWDVSETYTLYNIYKDFYIFEKKVV